MKVEKKNLLCYNLGRWYHAARLVPGAWLFAITQSLLASEPLSTIGVYVERDVQRAYAQSFEQPATRKVLSI